MAGAGKFLIPGLHDMHTHVTGFGRTALALLLANGVTSVRDMGADEFAVAKAWRDSIATGTLVGPRMRIASPIVESGRWLGFARRAIAAAGTPWRLHERFGPASAGEVVRWVDAVAALGADHIKVRNWPEADVAAAIVERAHVHGLQVVAHGNEPFPRTGITTVEHGIWPSPRSAAAAREYVPEHVRTEWQRQFLMLKQEGPMDWSLVHRMRLRDVAEMRRAGMMLLAGTDVGAPLIVPGFSLHDELELLVEEAGLTPIDALRAATVSPARVNGMADSLGTVAPGMLADLVLLDADPLSDIRRTRRVHAVIANGRLLDRARLDRMLKESKAVAH